MIDEYHWNFTGTGHETGPETRVRPNPGYHFYEHSRTRGERLEDLLGIALGDQLGDDRNGGGMVFTNDATLDGYFPG